MLNLDEAPEQTDFMLNETDSRMPDREISGILKDGMDRTIEEDTSINLKRRRSVQNRSRGGSANAGKFGAIEESLNETNSNIAHENPIN